MPNDLVSTLLVICAFVIFAEGLNKLHRADPLQRGLSLRQRLVVLLKVFAWILLVAGVGGVFVRPFIVVPHGAVVPLGAFLATDRASLLLILCGFALLIVRSRFKEHTPCERT